MKMCTTWITIHNAIFKLLVCLLVESTMTHHPIGIQEAWNTVTIKYKETNTVVGPHPHILRAISHVWCKCKNHEYTVVMPDWSVQSHMHDLVIGVLNLQGTHNVGRQSKANMHWGLLFLQAYLISVQNRHHCTSMRVLVSLHLKTIFHTTSGGIHSKRKIIPRWSSTYKITRHTCEL